MIVFLVIIMVVVILFVYYRKKGNRQVVNTRTKGREKIYSQYQSDEGNFEVVGYKDEFTVKKNGNIEFLVKNGQIIASRDLRIGKEFVYYEVK